MSADPVRSRTASQTSPGEPVQDRGANEKVEGLLVQRGEELVPHVVRDQAIVAVEVRDRGLHVAFPRQRQPRQVYARPASPRCARPVVSTASGRSSSPQAASVCAASSAFISRSLRVQLGEQAVRPHAPERQLRLASAGDRDLGAGRDATERSRRADRGIPGSRRDAGRRGRGRRSCGRALERFAEARHHHARHAAPGRCERREDLLADRLDRRPEAKRSRRAAARGRCGARRA